MTRRTGDCFTLMTSLGERARCDSVPGTISARARGASGRSRGEARKVSLTMWGWEKLKQAQLSVVGSLQILCSHWIIIIIIMLLTTALMP